MRHSGLVVTTLFAIVSMSDVPVAMAAKFDAQLSAGTGLSSWRKPERPTPFSLFSETPAGESGEGAEDFLLLQGEHGVSDDGNTVRRALERDWRGLGRDTAFFLGYQGVAAGILYLLPESVTKWTAEQRKTSMSRWWENVQHPHWDQDHWYVNYLGHPYFGATAYIRARERGFAAFGGFWYAALLSGLYEFGIEALFERPSYQDLIVTPVAGLLLGALFVLHSLLLCPILTPQEAKGAQERPHQGRGNVAHMPSPAQNTEHTYPRQGRERREGRRQYDSREVA